MNKYADFSMNLGRILHTEPQASDVDLEIDVPLNIFDDDLRPVFHLTAKQLCRPLRETFAHRPSFPHDERRKVHGTVRDADAQAARCTVAVQLRDTEADQLSFNDV